jgi:hypothetical protein
MHRMLATGFCMLNILGFFMLNIAHLDIFLCCVKMYYASIWHSASSMCQNTYAPDSKIPCHFYGVPSNGRNAKYL